MKKREPVAPLLRNLLSRLLLLMEMSPIFLGLESRIFGLFFNLNLCLEGWVRPAYIFSVLPLLLPPLQLSLHLKPAYL